VAAFRGNHISLGELNVASTSHQRANSAKYCWKWADVDDGVSSQSGYGGEVAHAAPLGDIVAPIRDAPCVGAVLGCLAPPLLEMCDAGSQTVLAICRLAPGDISDSQLSLELFTNTLETITTKFAEVIDSLINKSSPDNHNLDRQELCTSGLDGRDNAAHDLDLGAVLECVDAKLAVMTEVTMLVLCEKVYDESVLGLAATVASLLEDLAVAQDDILRTASLLKDEAAASDAKLKMVVETTLPSVCDKIFERTAKLLLLIDGRVKALESSSRLLAKDEKKDLVMEKEANLLVMMEPFDCRLLRLEASLLNLSGDSRDEVAPPLAAAEATHDVVTFQDGQYVRLTGLSSEHLNGTIGCIVGFDDLSSRYKVQYDGKSPVKIKNSNIEVASCLKCFSRLTSDVCFMCGDGACSSAPSVVDDDDDDDNLDAPPVSGLANHSRPFGRPPTSVQQSAGCVAARFEPADFIVKAPRDGQGPGTAA